MSWPQTVRKSDLRIDYYRGSGAGGQHRNKTDSACRITHIPTGIVAQAEDQRKQLANRRIAFTRLAKQLIPLMKAASRVEIKNERTRVRIRTYHEPRNQVKDHRVPGRSWKFWEVIDGHALDEIIVAVECNSTTEPAA